MMKFFFIRMQLTLSWKWIDSMLLVRFNPVVERADGYTQGFRHVRAASSLIDYQLDRIPFKLGFIGALLPE